MTPIPWLLKDPPFKVQSEALTRAAGRRGYGYFLEMGLGKTRCVLAEWLSLRKQNEKLNLVVVCPNSLKGAWRDEALGQGFKGTIRLWERDKFQDCGGPENGSKGHQPPPEGTIYIFNYESLLYDGGEVIERLVTHQPIYLAFDESVHIKNFNATVTKNAISYSKQAAFRRVLSGNPRPENVMDLWAQLRAIGELDGMNPYAFRGRFAVMGGYMNKQVKGQKNVEQLQEIMRRCSFVASKQDWTDLPEKVYLSPRRIKMTPEQTKIYKQMWNDFLVVVGDKECSAEQLINVLNKCQQVSSGFIKDDDGRDHEIMPVGSNPKIAELLDALQEVKGKTIIPCFYRWSCQAVYDVLSSKGRSPALMWGGMAVEEVDEQKRRFNTDDSCRDFVVQTRTGKYGHTLLGTDNVPCHTTVFFENDYSLDARIQIEDRNHRHGQRNVVSYQDLTASPAEDKVIKRLQEKREVSADFLRGLAQGAQK